MSFWIILILINVAFFVVPYLINIREQPNPVGFLFDKEASIAFKLKSVFRKTTSDPFRLLFEYTFLILVGALFGIQHVGFIAVCTLMGVAGWSMIFYNGVMVYVFGRNPVFRSDIEFAKTGLTLAYKHKYKIFFGVFLLLVLSSWGIYCTSAILLAKTPQTGMTSIALFIVTALGLFRIINYQFQVFHFRTVYSFIGHAAKSYQYGNRFNYLFDLNDAYFESLNKYNEFQLKKQPNLIFISVESYGSIVFKDKKRFEKLHQKLTSYEPLLAEKGFSMRSGIIRPPLFATGTWYSYCTMLFGIRIFDTTQYNLLFKNLNPFRKYQSILDVFKSKGYANYLLAPLGGGFKGLVDWTLTRNIFSYDHLLDWETLDFQGKPLPFMQLGYMPPDQFSLGRAKQLISEKGNGPYTMFFCSLNSHVPFTSPLEIVEDWESLNEEDASYEISSDQFTAPGKKYDLAITYQLDYLLDYVLKSGEEDDVFVLYGDHQPTLITKEQYGKETQMHIICKNKALLNVFKEKGFGEGLIPADPNTSQLNLEGFYSLFMEGINKAYGTDTSITFSYNEHGIILDES